METKKGFLELLLLTDEQEYTIDRYWERGGIFVLLLFILSVYCHIHRKPRCRLIASSKK